jgi:hypothetical protein
MKTFSISSPRSFPHTSKAVLVLALAAAALAGCAGTVPVPDPRRPAPVTDSPQLLRVCFIEGDAPHLAVGDQVEITTTSRGALTIRHIPGPDNKAGAWNDGKAVAVKAAVLVEQVVPRAGSKNTRRFVPVGRFSVQLGGVISSTPFDFLASKATTNLQNNRFPECNVSLGDDEVLVRGAKDKKRQDGMAHLR